VVAVDLTDHEELPGHKDLSDQTVRSRNLFLKSLLSLSQRKHNAVKYTENNAFKELSSQCAKSAKNAIAENQIKLGLQGCANLGHQDRLEEMESQESQVRLVREDTRELRECSVNLERMACRERKETKDHPEKISSEHQEHLEDKVSHKN